MVILAIIAILLCLLALKKAITYHKNYLIHNIKFNDNNYAIVLNKKTYSYNDIQDIKIELDVEDIPFYVQHDSGRFVIDKITFFMKHGIAPEVCYTQSRNELYKILKHISKYKFLNFNIEQYKPVLLTGREIFIIIFIIIYITILILASHGETTDITL